MKKLLLLLLLLPALAVAQTPDLKVPRAPRAPRVKTPRPPRVPRPPKEAKLPKTAAKPRQPSKKKDYLVTLTTQYGPLRLVLHDQTPHHKANFIKLVDQKFYDGLLFHRIIEQFMIQGGDPNSRTATADQALGNGDVGYTIPAEFSPDLFHKKGALAAARDNNPAKASSGCQFYVVQGRVWDEENLQKQITRSLDRGGRAPTDAQRQVYKTLGGTPHLDGNYTVFGEVIDGLNVVDSIAKQPRNAQDRPQKDIRMTVTGEWLRKKKITKKYKYAYK